MADCLDDEALIGLGQLTIEPALRLVRHGQGAEEVLQPRIMQVLVALIRANGQILTRDALTASCWDGVVVGDDSINRVIGQLRRLSEGIGRGCFQVETITRVGYRLICTAEVPTNARRSDTSQAAVPRLSICVLPFANMSGDQEQETKTDQRGHHRTDLLRSRLAGVAASAFRDEQHVDPPKVARELGVSHRRGGERPRRLRRAGADHRRQLVDAATNDHVRRSATIGDLDRHLLQAVLRTDQARLLVGRWKPLPLKRRRRSSARWHRQREAHDVHLMARQHWPAATRAIPGSRR